MNALQEDSNAKKNATHVSTSMLSALMSHSQSRSHTHFNCFAFFPMDFQEKGIVQVVMDN